MINRRWALADRVGRRWRVSIGASATPAASGDDRARNALDGLVYSYLHGSHTNREYAAQLLFEIYNELTGNSVSYREWSGADLGSARFLSNEIAMALDRALRSGRLSVEADHRPSHFLRVEEPAPATVAQPFVEDAYIELSFIEIELRDEDGNPVPNAHYILVAPGNDTRAGTTNGQGFAREERLIAGDCTVSFPDLHAPDWSMA